MRPLPGIFLIATIVAVLLTAASLSIGNDRPSDAEPAMLVHAAKPVAGNPIEASTRADRADRRADKCISESDVLALFERDVESVGGEIMMMTEGAQQAFADAWRNAIDRKPVEVSLILAHVVPAPDAEPIVDVVEFGGDGCALSRTLMAAADWDALIERAAGYFA